MTRGPSVTKEKIQYYSHRMNWGFNESPFNYFRVFAYDLYIMHRL